MVVKIIKSQSYKYYAPKNKEILEVYQLNNLEKTKEIIGSLKEQKEGLIENLIKHRNFQKNVNERLLKKQNLILSMEQDLIKHRNFQKNVNERLLKKQNLILSMEQDLINHRNFQKNVNEKLLKKQNLILSMKQDLKKYELLKKEKNYKKDVIHNQNEKPINKEKIKVYSKNKPINEEKIKVTSINKKNLEKFDKSKKRKLFIEFNNIYLKIQDYKFLEKAMQLYKNGNFISLRAFIIENKRNSPGLSKKTKIQLFWHQIKVISLNKSLFATEKISCSFLAKNFLQHLKDQPLPNFLNYLELLKNNMQTPLTLRNFCDAKHNSLLYSSIKNEQEGLSDEKIFRYVEKYFSPSFTSK